MNMYDRTATSLLSAKVRKPLIFAVILGLSSGVLRHEPRGHAEDGKGVLLSAMQGELHRAIKGLAKADPTPYFISYSSHDQHSITLTASLGAIMRSMAGRVRTADVIVRVGDHTLDNSHGMPVSPLVSDTLPMADNYEAIARVLWRLTDVAYKRAAGSYLNIRARAAVRAEEEDNSPDFSEEPPQNRAENSSPQLVLDRTLWEERMRRYSAAFRKYPELYASGVFFQADHIRSAFVSSEGTVLAQTKFLARIVIDAGTRAEDGMELTRGEVMQSTHPQQLPPEKEIFARVEKIAADLKALRSAPFAEPFDGPALLSGEAAAVFFHEVLGHRLEGHRQRNDQEGQTFTRKINQQILPEFLSLVSDPTLTEISGTTLTGAYDFDEEGVPGSRVNLIENGILKNFLMSRIPIRGFNHSNGHGRAQPGRMTTARQSNLIVRSAKTASDLELRRRLLEEVRKQGKPYGLYFENMLGGFTITQRGLPQSFQLLPVLVWRVRADGSPDELIRGADIVGTPLAALRNIVVTGEKLHIFNGICGAESGQIPVSAAAPAILFSSMEVQKRALVRTKPPVLSPPVEELIPSEKPNSVKGSDAEALP